MQVCNQRFGMVCKSLSTSVGLVEDPWNGRLCKKLNMQGCNHKFGVDRKSLSTSIGQ